MNSQRIGLVVAIAAGCALVVGAALTTPFTLDGDLVTALALGAFLAVQGGFLIRARQRGDRPEVATFPSFRRFVPWVAVFLAVTAFELLSYFSEPRHAHPTLSSLSDDLTSSPTGRAVLFLAWLMLGWLLLKRPIISGQAES